MSLLGKLSALILIRAIMGVFGAFLFPAVNTLLAAWVPRKERTTLGTFVLGGGQVSLAFQENIRNYHVKHLVFLKLLGWGYFSILHIGCYSHLLSMAGGLLLLEHCYCHLVYRFCTFFRCCCCLC